MGLPSRYFLRHPGGEPIGPLALRALEVLFDSRILASGTPVSTDGREFQRLDQLPELTLHLEAIKRRLGLGEDPWEDSGEAEPWDGDGDTPVEASEYQAAGDAETPVLRLLLDYALAHANGRLELGSHRGEILFIYKDGKIISLATTIPEHTLEAYLMGLDLCGPADLEEARIAAPSMGGDLGTALVASGKIAPDVYFEKFVAWGWSVLGAALSQDFDVREFILLDEVPNPAVPLGFDRLSVVVESVRKGLSRTWLSERLLPKRGCPLIISQVEGISMEDMKLRPKELRVLKEVDGVKTLGDLIDTLGGSEDKTLPLLQAVHLAEQCGFIVFGDDPLLRKEDAEADELERVVEGFRKKNYFEILNVSERSSDEEVRGRYTDFAKRYHPDKLRQNAAPRLLAARRAAFAIIEEAFSALEGDDARYRYANDVAAGHISRSEDLETARRAVQAETLFKKAEIFARMRKYDEALLHLRQAIELNPGDTEFKIYRAYLEFQKSKGAHPEEAAQKAIARILDYMRNDANIASGYLFLGHLHKAAGKPDVAVRYFERVLEYDEHHQEALREVRVANMRKDKSKKKVNIFGVKL